MPHRPVRYNSRMLDGFDPTTIADLHLRALINALGTHAYRDQPWTDSPAPTGDQSALIGEGIASADIISYVKI